MSSFFGFGVYGLNLALSWAADPMVELICTRPFNPRDIVLDPLGHERLAPVLTATAAFQERLKASAGSRLSLDLPMLAGVDGNFVMDKAVHDVALTGAPMIAVTFFDADSLTSEAVDRAANFDLIVAGSTWNAETLRAHGLARVATVLQGIDPELFHPAPQPPASDGRFRVFSGGKLERRKGQDIVLAAFRRFAARHEEAVLEVAWRSPWPQGARSLDASALAAPVPFTAQGQVDIAGWADANGLAPYQVIDLGFVPNALLPGRLRQMDVAVFPNRCEGGTNLVAMECMACGVPTILSANTGHMDLIDGDNCYPLQRQLLDEATGWGESDVDEVVEALEQVYADREKAARRGAMGARTLAGMTWTRTAASMKDHMLAQP
jgi:glycosyltransferase involved in cell wall biosynthesis